MIPMLILIALVAMFRLLILVIMFVALALLLALTIIVPLLLDPLIMLRMILNHKIFGIPAITDWLLIVTIFVRAVFLPISLIMQTRLILINHNLITAV